MRQILDGTIHRAAADTVPDDFMYNVRFTAPDAVYLLDTETGYFSREMDGEIKYGELAENWREQAFSRLGVLNHVAR